MDTTNLSDASKQSLAEYDKWSSTYDDCPNRTRDLDATVLRSVGLDMQGKTVGEFGCGTGRHTEWFMEQQGEGIREYTAMDISEVK